jgi:D-tagatose-1,6-bisphosphate aldolase subunit GatZ/KbaZ
VGVYAVCSAHPDIIAAAARAASENDAVLHVESTSSQVNQFGGYTGQTPEQFASFLKDIAYNAGLSADRVLLGSDHLGPFPWRREPAAVAMDRARGLVCACVLAGYQKIHLDASMPCADDPQSGLDERTVAERAATLCETAETTFHRLPPNAPPLLYVVGAEVPTPGGELDPEESILITTAEHVRSTLDTFERAFAKTGLSDAWQRVIGMVVQPGVEFGDNRVFDYDRRKTKALGAALPGSPSLVFEAHSTDYQLPSSLKQMVEDHFAILKVGPELSFAFREAVFSLSAIEQAMLRGKTAHTSSVREALETAMLRNPSYWRDYYHGDEAQLRISRFYSYSDRCRYYWHESDVKAEIDLLKDNLTAFPAPLPLISQYLPIEYAAIRLGRLQAVPSEIIRHHIGTVLNKYAIACGERP